MQKLMLIQKAMARFSFLLFFLLLSEAFFSYIYNMLNFPEKRIFYRIFLQKKQAANLPPASISIIVQGLPCTSICRHRKRAPSTSLPPLLPRNQHFRTAFFQSLFCMRGGIFCTKFYSNCSVDNAI